MSRPQSSSSVPVQQTPSSVTAAGQPKPTRDKANFKIVPDSLVIDDDRDLEPKWAAAIDTATD
jgi:hypothetical protein